MRFRLSILTLFRSPTKTLVTFVLLFATSFAFVSRGAEYATTVAEIDKAEAQYSAVGTLQRSTEGYYEYMENLLGEEVYELEGGAYIDRLSNATAPLDAEVVDLVLGTEYIAQDEFFMVAGGLTSAELTNITEQPLYDVPNYSEWNWYQTEGTFEMDTGLVESVYLAQPYVVPMKTGNNITKVVVGDRSHIYGENRRFVAYNNKYADSSYYDTSINDHIGWRTHGDKYLDLVTTRWDNPDSFFGFQKMLVTYVDYPFFDLSYIENEYGVTDYYEILSNPEKYGTPRYHNVFGFEPVPVLEYVETLYRNFHTQELVHISGMDVLSKYHSGEMYIVDGRAISDDDTRNVCVVNLTYAEQNGLVVGDTIEFELSADTLMHSGKVFGREPPYPAINYEGEYYNRTAEHAKIASEQSLTERGLGTVTQTYEIVGIWSDSTYEVSDPFSYSPNTVFVPASTYPWIGEVEPTMLPSTFGFTLNHPGDMAKIEAELGDTLAALGYELLIDDMGYAEAKPNFEFMKLSALIGFVAMSAALLLSLVLITYLFIIRKKRDYAIMRALGTTRSCSNRSLLVGLFALAIPAVFLGSLLTLALTQGFAADLSAQISEITGNATASSMPAWLVGAFGTGVLGLLLIFARFGLARVGRTPPLALLQGR